MENRNNNPRMVSLFSGCGGLDLGFIQAGFDVVWANDFDTDAQAVYRLNIGEIDGRDILEVDEKEIPDCDILTAGFPCQPFSNAGSRRGVHDSRGMLYKECLRIIEEKMPKVIVFENVKGILSTNHINGRKLVDTIVEDLWDMNGIGYEVNYQLINASDYGVPQNRQRVLFVGVRKDLGMQFQFPEKQEKKNLTLEHILNIPKDVPNQVDWPLSPQALEMIQYIPEGGSWKNVPYEHLAPRFKRIRDNMKRYHSPNFYRRFARNEICGTMTASAQPENCGIVHPTENRRFTIREVARIQTFPDTFLFLDDSVKNVTAMYKVIGNAVPVKLANVLATAIREQVFQRKESTMDTDKAYLLGLIIGGGIWGNAEDVFRIRLPFKQWGSYESNPRRAGEISRDVMKMVSPLFRAIYNISVSYDTSASGVWNILCEGDLTQLREELEGYGITCEGEVRKTANINHIVPELVDNNLKRRFIAGLADTIGSTKSTHRRFSKDKQMVSFEISGFAYEFVCSLCKLLHSIGCYPD